MMKRVVFVEPWIGHYRFRFLEAMAEELAEQNIDLRVACHQRSPAGTFADGPGLPVARARLGRWSLRLGDTELFWLTRLLKATRDADLVIVSQQLRNLTLHALLARQALGGPPVALWGHGHTPGTVAAGDGIPRRAKELLSRSAHWWFAYTDEVAARITGFGYPQERVTSVQNSTDTRGLRRELARLTDEDLRPFEQEHDLDDRPMLLFLGSFREEKQLPFLISAFRHVSEHSGAILALAGSGELSGFVEDSATRLTWMRSLGPLAGRDMALALRRSHAVVVPAWAGLVVVDAFAAGVPFVTRAGAAHPPEAGYLQHGANALVVDDGGAPEVFAEALCGLMDQPDRHRELCAGALASGGTYSAELMADRFSRGIVAALDAAPRNQRYGVKHRR